MSSKVKVQPFFITPVYSKSLSNHIAWADRLLQAILPKALLQEDTKLIAEWLNSHLPLIRWGSCSQFPDTLSISLLCSTQISKASALFIELLKKWLIPEKEIEIISKRSLSFYLKGMNTQHLHLLEVEVLIERERDFTTVQANLPLLEKELSLSMISSKYSEYILNTKSLSHEQKSTLVHQELRRIFQRYSSHFDQELFVDLSKLLALSQNEFRSIRPARQMTRLVVSHYLLRKQLIYALNKYPEKRHLLVRFIPTKLQFPFNTKEVLGLVLSMGLMDKYENLDENHIGLAVQKFIPDARIVKGSFCPLLGTQDPIRGLYIELEKKGDDTFSLNEMHLLRSELALELNKRIEKLIPSVFMIRNEEETMKNILLLSQELRDGADIPQVMISLDKQTDQHLIFTIILVRLLGKEEKSLKESFQHVQGNFEFSSDRIQNVGYLNKLIPKEANVFHLSIPKVRALLRADSSVNFYLAREQVVKLLNQAIGEIRDYNGGMILKQGELFSQFKLSFSKIAKKNEELLENFFFGLSPIEMQATLLLPSLKMLFKLFLEATGVVLEKKEHYFLKMRRREGQLFAALSVRDPTFEEDLNQELVSLENFSRSLIKTKVDFQGQPIWAFICEQADLKKQNCFKKALQRAIQRWINRIASQQELHLSFLVLPLSLDPRQGGDDLSETILKMLFDGLTRISPENKPELSLAKNVETSSDFKRYTFQLRHCYWSNGSRVVAKDFEYAWKKVLSPHFQTEFAYMFYPIKNARKAKQGEVGLEEVGVRAVDEKTLVVDLEYPTPEFLELTAHTLYSPIHHQVDRIYPNWAQGGEEAYVCNGPFKLKKIYPNGGFELIKNPHYWDGKAIQLERISITRDPSTVVYERFKNNETDWLGRPLRPWDSRFAKGLNDIVHGSPIWTSWCVFNTQRYPFHSTKLRQAFALVINRSEMNALSMQGALPAASPLPFSHAQFHEELLKYDLKRASRLFDEALEELGINRKDFPLITLIHLELKSREKLAKTLQKRFQEVFGIHCRLEGYSYSQLFAKITKGEHQMGIISWKAWINDPIYTLNAFKYRDNINFAKWEHVEFKQLLDRAQCEINPSKRLELLKEAEKILILQAPVIPLFYEVNSFMYKGYLKNIVFTPNGNVDFKWASIERGNPR